MRLIYQKIVFPRRQARSLNVPEATGAAHEPKLNRLQPQPAGEGRGGVQVPAVAGIETGGLLAGVVYPETGDSITYQDTTATLAQATAWKVSVNQLSIAAHQYQSGKVTSVQSGYLSVMALIAGSGARRAPRHGWRERLCLLLRRPQRHPQGDYRAVRSSISEGSSRALRLMPPTPSWAPSMTRVSRVIVPALLRDTHPIPTRRQPRAPCSCGHSGTGRPLRSLREHFCRVRYGIGSTRPSVPCPWCRVRPGRTCTAMVASRVKRRPTSTPVSPQARQPVPGSTVTSSTDTIASVLQAGGGRAITPHHLQPGDPTGSGSPSSARATPRHLRRAKRNRDKPRGSPCGRLLLQSLQVFGRVGLGRHCVEGAQGPALSRAPRRRSAGL